MLGLSKSRDARDIPFHVLELAERIGPRQTMAPLPVPNAECRLARAYNNTAPIFPEGSAPLSTLMENTLPRHLLAMNKEDRNSLLRMNRKMSRRL